MLSLDETLLRLRNLFSDLQKAENTRDRIQRQSLNNPGEAEERLVGVEAWIRSARQQLDVRVRDLIRYPPQFDRHFRLLDAFHQKGACPFEKSVFLMTKFPQQPAQPADLALQAVIDVVKQAVKDGGYSPRLASDQAFHPMLWDNVELYLLGCGAGIAIVEDQYKGEFNPNVAMEWGWMRAMGKPVLYLVEADFEHARADVAGFLDHRFAWANPQQDIPGHVKAWLAGLPR